VDEELKQLNLATAAARRVATEALDALRTPQAALREAAGEYIGSVAARRLAASRHASVEVMAQLSDDDIAELRLWTDEQMALAREEVERGIQECDFWIPEVSGLSPTDVSQYSGALMPKPKDTRTGIPQELNRLFDECLAPIRRGLSAIGLAVIPAAAEPRIEFALVRAWRAYRDAAVVCVSRWAEVDERYHATAERFQEMRWELAGQVDPETIRARWKSEDADESDEAGPADESVAAQADAAAKSPPEAVVRADSETLIPAT
jgi:hypothetical protein